MGGSMKSPKLKTPPPKKSDQELQFVDMELVEGDTILFTPTGEELRISSIEEERIVIERRP